MIAALGDLAFEYRTPKDRYILERVVKENLYQVPADLQGRTVVDIGAHIGSCTVLAAAAGARVIAIEPEASNVALLRTNIAGNQNRFTGAALDVAAIAGAVAERAGVHRLFMHESNTGCHSLFRDLAGQALSVFQDVLAIEIGELFSHYGVDQIALVKIDCEGAERFILPRLIEKLPAIDAIAVEFHDRNTPLWARRAFADAGWKSTRLTDYEWRFSRE